VNEQSTWHLLSTYPASVSCYFIEKSYFWWHLAKSAPWMWCSRLYYWTCCHCTMRELVWGLAGISVVLSWYLLRPRTVHLFTVRLHSEVYSADTHTGPKANSAFIPPGSVNEYQLWLGRQRQVWFIPLADERGVCRWNCEIPWERVPYLSALEVCSRPGAIQIHVYLYLTFTSRTPSNSELWFGCAKRLTQGSVERGGPCWWLIVHNVNDYKNY